MSQAQIAITWIREISKQVANDESGIILRIRAIRRNPDIEGLKWPANKELRHHHIVAVFLLLQKVRTIILVKRYLREEFPDFRHFEDKLFFHLCNYQAEGSLTLDPIHLQNQALAFWLIENPMVLQCLLNRNIHV
jgi:hypothetical protein